MTYIKASIDERYDIKSRQGEEEDEYGEHYMFDEELLEQNAEKNV